ncbi:hypothetical protein F7725_003664 [Dissostichus mawsoni]|uniref:Uncharacterized protein n=1 Tax=Dissostichus mawsoni TaxID=36200 RepID=A0A7J5YAU0_DISMA|nr:hypothetical protein F7725_003664 [Dissostichus mawsoni]
MDDDAPDEAFKELHTGDIGGWGVAQIAAGTGLAVLEAHQQGFTPAVGYELNPWLLRLARFKAWRAGHHEKVSYRREDLWKKKLEAELPEDALVIAGRFPFPDWTPYRVEGEGVHRAWAYNMQAQRQNSLKKNDSHEKPPQQ